MGRNKNLRPWLWAAAALLLIFTLQNTPAGQRLNLGMAPLLDALHAPARWWSELLLWTHERQSLQQNYLKAEEKLEKQAALIQEVNSLRQENRQLRGLLGIREISGYHWHAAKVRGRSPDAMNQRLILEVSGVQRDDVIVSSEGLVGLVDTASGSHAVIRTILDASVAVPVTIEGEGIAALVRGQNSRLQVEFIPWAKVPTIGTILRTSGAGGIFPPGIPVARITELHKQPGEVFAAITAEPVAHWQRDNWLAVAGNAPPKP